MENHELQQKKTGQRRAEMYRRREFLAFGAGLGATVLAGCAGQTDSPTTATDPESTATAAESTASTGTFRLLISDQPTAIGEFDRLDVSLSHARVFPAGTDSDGDEETETEEPTETDEETETGEAATESPEDDEESEEGDREEDDQEEGNGQGEQGEQGQGKGEEAERDDEEDEEDADDQEDEGSKEGEEEDGGFFEIELGGATVDLTEVVGEKAIEVFDGELKAGRYTKLELHVAEVEGIVAGEQVSVKVPSEKLQIVKPFEVVPGETLSFVFDINVVKKGQTGEYNLLPVISKSGVAGKDVAVEEVDPGEVEQSGTETNGNETTGGPPDDAGGDD